MENEENEFWYDKHPRTQKCDTLCQKSSDVIYGRPTNLKLRPPECDVMETFTETSIGVTLGQHSLLLALPHQPGPKS
jgi:hypothetical protein